MIINNFKLYANSILNANLQFQTEFYMIFYFPCKEVASTPYLLSSKDIFRMTEQ